MNTRRPVRATVTIEYDNGTSATLEVLAEDALYDTVRENIQIRNSGTRPAPQIEIVLAGAAGRVVGWPAVGIGAIPDSPEGLA